MLNLLRFLTTYFIIVFSTNAKSSDEVTLFNGAGKAQASIDIDGEMTIYLWSGKPVAYLIRDDDGGFHVYSFNVKHLGWFVKGIIRDHQKNASCAIKEAIDSTEYEPYKSYKQYKPCKAYTEYSPYRPYFSSSFGDIACQFFLGDGGK